MRVHHTSIIVCSMGEVVMEEFINKSQLTTSKRHVIDTKIIITKSWKRDTSSIIGDQAFWNLRDCQDVMTIDIYLYRIGH